jgi:two-component system nitrate/nitrite response regulator NarL
VTVKERLKVLITGSSRVMREVVADALGGRGFQVFCASTEEMDAFDLPLSPQIVLLLGDVGKAQLIGAIRRARRRIVAGKIVLLGTCDGDADVLSFIEAGAHGVVHNGETFQQLLDVIESVQTEKSPCSPRMTAQVFARIGSVARQQRSASVETADLTPREQQVLYMLAAGHSNKEIGQFFSISVSTVKNHVHHILEKLRLHSRREAITSLEPRRPDSPVALLARSREANLGTPSEHPRSYLDLGRSS